MSQSARVVQALANHTDVDPVDSPSLYGAIEPGALDTALVTGESGTLAFESSGHRVPVDGDAMVRVDETRDLRTREGDR